MIRLKDAAGRWVHDLMILENGKIAKIMHTYNSQNALLFKEYDPIIKDLVGLGLFVIR